MKIGVPREVKNHEYRVAITPAGVRELTGHGHEVFVEKDAGAGSELGDDAYVAAGATIIPDPDEVWRLADLVLKVKEPVAEEYHRMRQGQVLFTYLTWPPTRPAPTPCSRTASRASPTRPFSSPTAACRCSRRCLRSPAGWPRRSAPTT
jgi:alanine dehydrogenase